MEQRHMATPVGAILGRRVPARGTGKSARLAVFSVDVGNVFDAGEGG